MIVDLETARLYPIAHPNCRRTTTPHVTALSLDDAIESAVTAQARAHRPHVAATPRRASTGTDFTQGAMPATASARRHTATLAKHGLIPPTGQ